MYGITDDLQSGVQQSAQTAGKGGLFMLAVLLTVTLLAWRTTTR